MIRRRVVMLLAVCCLFVGVVAYSSPAQASVAVAWTRGLAWYQANTGIEPGHMLTLHPGDWTLTAADSGHTFTDINVTGTIYTSAASNVTFTDVKAYQQRGSLAGSTITFNHCELDATVLGGDPTFVDEGDDATYNFCNIHGGVRGLAFGKTGAVYDSWLHDFQPSTHNPQTHRESILSNGNPGGSIKLQRDWFESGSWSSLSAEIGLFGDFGRIENVTLTGSVMVDSGSYQADLGSVPGKNFPLALNVVAANNVFGPAPEGGPPGAQYGHMSYLGSGNGNAEYANLAVPVGQNPDTYTGALITVP